MDKITRIRSDEIVDSDNHGPEKFDSPTLVDELCAQLDSGGGVLKSIRPSKDGARWQVNFIDAKGGRTIVEGWPLARALYDACCWNER